MKSVDYNGRRCHGRYANLYHIFDMWWKDDASLLNLGPKSVPGPTLEQTRKVVPLGANSRGIST